MNSRQKSFLRNEVIDWLKENVSPKRLKHILGVERTCIDLANIHRINPEKAAKGGLMHDLAKFFPPRKLLKIARKEGIEIDDICSSSSPFTSC